MSKVVSLLGRFPKRKPTGNRTRQRALKDAGQIGNGCVELGHQQPSSTPTQYDGSVEFNYTYCINKKIYKRRRRRKRILWMFTLACPVADLRVTLSHPSKPSPSTTLQPTTNPPPLLPKQQLKMMKENTALVMFFLFIHVGTHAFSQPRLRVVFTQKTSQFNTHTQQQQSSHPWWDLSINAISTWNHSSRSTHEISRMTIDHEARDQKSS